MDIKQFVAPHKEAVKFAREGDIKGVATELTSFLQRLIHEQGIQELPLDKVKIGVVISKVEEVLQELRTGKFGTLSIEFLGLKKEEIGSVKPKKDIGGSEERGREKNKPTAPKENPKKGSDADSAPFFEGSDESAPKYENEEPKIETDKDDKSAGGNFEPQTLDEFIGQKQTVRALKKAIEVAKIDGLKCIANKGGVLLLGNRGLGKSTIMRLVGKELGVKVEFFDASSLRNDVESRRRFDTFLERIARENQPVVIAVDEIHKLSDDLQSRLLVLLQDRVYTNLDKAGQTINLPIKEFTFIGATTEEHDILVTLLDRFKKGLICTLEDYAADELRQIIKGKVSYYKLTISEDAIAEIIKRGRSSIREIESFILGLRGEAVLEKQSEISKEMTLRYFEENKIYDLGLTAMDIKILEALEQAPSRTLSEENIASKVGVQLQDFQTNRKPYLIKIDFILSSNKGQTITEKGVEYLKLIGENN